MLFPNRTNYYAQFYHSDSRLFFFVRGGGANWKSMGLFCRIFQLDPALGEAQILPIASFHPFAPSPSPLDKVRKILGTKRYSLRICVQGGVQKIYFQKGFYSLNNSFKERAVELFNAGDASNIPLFTLGYLYRLLEADEIGAIQERAMKHVSSHPIMAWAVLTSYNDKGVGDLFDRMGSCLRESAEQCDDQDLWQYLNCALDGSGMRDTILKTCQGWAERRIGLFKHDGSDPCEMVRRGIEFVRSFFWAKPLPFLELSFKSYDRNPIGDLNRFLDLVDRLGSHYERGGLWCEAARVYRIGDRFRHHGGGLAFEPLAERASPRDFLTLVVYHLKKGNLDKAAGYLDMVDLEGGVDNLQWIVARQIRSGDLIDPQVSRSSKKQRR